MNTLSPLGLITCFIFSMLLSGASLDKNGNFESSPYVINHSHSTVYFKPESKDANPGLQFDGAYTVKAGETLYAPVDAIVTSSTKAGKIFQVPTGSRVLINESGNVVPLNMIAQAGLL